MLVSKAFTAHVKITRTRYSEPSEPSTFRFKSSKGTRKPGAWRSGEKKKKKDNFVEATQTSWALRVRLSPKVGLIQL